MNTTATACPVVEPTFDDAIREREAICWLVANNPINQPAVNAVIEAIRTAARLNGNRVSRNTVAPHIPVWVPPQVIGATFSGLVSKKALAWTGEWDESQDHKGRNSGKPCKVYDVQLARS